MTSFDTFLSYNSQDRPIVRQLADALVARGLRPWLDERELVPGRPWQEALEQIIQTTKTAAVLFGPAGLGPWEEPEMWACLSEFVNRKLPVIPVLLPGAPQQPNLPLFLKAFTWVDLRSGFSDDGLDRLVWGITGQKPAPPATVDRLWADLDRAMQKGGELHGSQLAKLVLECLPLTPLALLKDYDFKSLENAIILADDRVRDADGVSEKIEGRDFAAEAVEKVLVALGKAVVSSGRLRTLLVRVTERILALEAIDMTIRWPVRGKRELHRKVVWGLFGDVKEFLLKHCDD